MGAKRLTADDVREMRRRAAAGESITKIAEDFPVSYSPAREAIRGESWSHIKDPPPVPGRGNGQCVTKLTKEEVLEARRRRQEGEPVKEIAADMGRPATTLADAISGRSWSHLDQPTPKRNRLPRPEAGPDATPCRGCQILTVHTYCVYCRSEGRAQTLQRPETQRPHMGVV